MGPITVRVRGGDGYGEMCGGCRDGLRHPRYQYTCSPRLYLRQLNLNGCAYTFPRTNGDATPHPLGQLLTDGQPQPNAFGVASSPIETLENVGKVGRAYPGSLIFHADSTRSCPQPYIPTTARMLYSIAEKDQEDLLQPLGIGAPPRGTLAFDT